MCIVARCRNPGLLCCCWGIVERSEEWLIERPTLSCLWQLNFIVPVMCLHYLFSPHKMTRNTFQRFSLKNKYFSIHHNFVRWTKNSFQLVFFMQESVDLMLNSKQWNSINNPEVGNKAVFDWKDIQCIAKSIMWCWEV